MPRRRPPATISLPWENQGSRLGRFLAGARRRAVVVSVLVVLAVYGLVHTVDRRNAERATYLAIADTEDAVRRFRTDNQRCPRAMEELLHPPIPGTHYLLEVPRDGWGHPLLVRCPSVRDPDEADVLAAGPSGSFYDDDFPR